MTTLFEEEQGALNVTLVECEPNVISAIRNQEKDNYSAVQLETNKTEKKNIQKEFRVEEDELKNYEIGKNVDVEVFEVGSKVKVSGITKAKGFQGVMKRHGFHGSPKTHGHRHDHRAPGSIGSAYPQRVLKGKKMAGRMGGNRFSVKNLQVVLVDKEKSLIAIKGAIPGNNGSVVEIVG